MSTDRRTPSRSEESWTVLTSHDWDGSPDLDTALSTVLYELDGVDEGAILYDYVDTEAVSDALGSHRSDRGVSEVRFSCERHEIRITSDGTIAAR